MNLQEQVITLEQAERLIALGIKAPCTFYWYNGDTGNNVDHILFNWLNHIDYDYLMLPAYTVAELGVMLPQVITFKKTQKASLKITRMNAWTLYYHRHSSGSNVVMKESKIEAHVRGDLLIYLLEKHLITPEQVNERLK